MQQGHALDFGGGRQLQQGGEMCITSAVWFCSSPTANLVGIKTTEEDPFDVGLGVDFLRSGNWFRTLVLIPDGNGCLHISLGGLDIQSEGCPLLEHPAVIGIQIIGHRSNLDSQIIRRNRVEHLPALIHSQNPCIPVLLALVVGIKQVALLVSQLELQASDLGWGGELQRQDKMSILHPIRPCIPSTSHFVISKAFENEGVHGNCTGTKK
ncbi:hypothetical protein SDC9_60907 [bioreactor metagenome]|uniref:Uncharacterized protein n=1 Tax=bioreactor metagenome TaxID=1076179 RepID=A0A644XK00_9ZZZZ